MEGITRWWGETIIDGDSELPKISLKMEGMTLAEGELTHIQMTLEKGLKTNIKVLGSELLHGVVRL